MAEKSHHEEFMLVVGYVAGTAPFMLLARVSVDMAEPLPDPPLTPADFQPVAFAAKMALAKVLRRRRRASCSCGSNGGDAWKCAKRQGRMDVISCRCACHKYLAAGKELPK